MEDFVNKIQQLRAQVAAHNEALDNEQLARVARHEELRKVISERRSEAEELRIKIKASALREDGVAREYSEIQMEIKKLRQEVRKKEVVIAPSPPPVRVERVTQLNL